MEKLKVLDLFSGIGGFSLGLQWTGHFEPIAFAEKDDFCRRVLRKHWPEIPQFEDIRDVTIKAMARRSIGRPDIITAGFPCQPFSVAGRQDGQNDDRYLWPELIKVIGEIRPRYVLLENVPGIISIKRGDVFKQILAEITACGYDAEWDVIPASALGAWHRRDRFWLVAYPHSEWQLQPERRKPNQWRRPGYGSALVSDPYGIGYNQPKAEQDTNTDQKWNLATRGQSGRAVIYEAKSGCQNVPDAMCQRLQWWGSVFGNVYPQLAAIERTHRNGRGIWAAEPNVGRVAHGVTSRVDRIRSLGNAVVPQVVEWIGYQIARFENERRMVVGETMLYPLLNDKGNC